MDDQATLSPESWVDQYGDMLFQFAYSRVGKADVAEELVQETFLAAIRAGKNSKADRLKKRGCIPS
jgi:DNA-directed RNA polymerase specialized sigma24 family protein